MISRADQQGSAKPLRPPKQVMRLARLGSLHQCRLSFMRILTRQLAQDHWSFVRHAFAIDDQGVGHAVYTAKGPERSYSLVAFAHDLPPEMRSDRVIATAWDATFTLFDGVPEQADIARLAQNVPVQEAGRISEQEFSLSRANRSVRLWEHVVERLAQGLQPDTELLAQVGYLMRTTAVYGSGKFGAADYATISGRPEFNAPFQAEMLSVYLIRWFVRDLANHMARARGGDQAVPLDPDIARTLGIGNSTGLGLGPFIINHPKLFNNWLLARETAIARVRSIQCANPDEVATFRKFLGYASQSIGLWRSEHPVQLDKLASLKRDVHRLIEHTAGAVLEQAYPWDQLIIWSERSLNTEGQELLASLILEPYGELVDDLAKTMSDPVPSDLIINGSMLIAEVKSLLEQNFDWAFDMDWAIQANCARAWYVSAEKLEPRLGERFEEPLEPYEQPLAPARDAAAAYHALTDWDETKPVAEFLLRHPEHRHTIRRAQISANAPYAEIRDNTIGEDLFPVDLLRAKLAFFGATQFDPRSDRWLRICMFGGAPYPEELTRENADFWVYPPCTTAR